MVGVGRMPHSEEEAEQQERQDIQGSSGHAHTLTWLSPSRNIQCLDPTTPIRVCVRAP
jgi:hypothetical protein